MLFNVSSLKEQNEHVKQEFVKVKFYLHCNLV